MSQVEGQRQLSAASAIESEPPPGDRRGGKGGALFCAPAGTASQPLIDAAPAGECERERQQQQQQQAAARDERGAGLQQAGASRQPQQQRALAAAEQLDKTNRQTDELNNNSIVADKSPPSPAQKKQQDQAAGCKTPGFLQPARESRAETTPLNLLKGLRMQASQIRGQRAGEQASLASGGGGGERRKQSGEGASTAPASTAPAQQSRVSPGAYVESSLDRPETTLASTTRPAGDATVSSAANRPVGHNYKPAYTNLYQPRPLAQSPASSTGGAEQPAKAPVSYTQFQSISRSTLIKQQASQQQVADSSARSLFTRTSPTSRPLETSSQRLQSLFESHSASRPRGDASERQRLHRVQRIDSDQDDDDDERNPVDFEEDEDDDDDAFGYQGQSLDERSTQSSSLSGQPQLRQQQLKQDAVRRKANSPEPHKVSRGQARPGSSRPLVATPTRRARSPARRNGLEQRLGAKLAMGSQQQQQQQQPGASGKKQAQSESPTRISFNQGLGRPPSFNTTTQQQQQHDVDLKMASCRKLDLLEQVAHLDCACSICAKNRKLASLHDNLYHHQSHHQLMGGGGCGSTSKLSHLNLNKSADRSAYPKTRFVHMVLKSIILVLCTILLLLLLVGTILVSHYLPQSMDRVVNASRSFNVTIAGRR